MLIDDFIWYYANVGDTNMVDALTIALRFKIDNVAQYAYETHVSSAPSGEKLSFSDLDKWIPNIAPLAPIMWFEFGGLAKGEGKSATNQYGCLLSIDYDRKEDSLEKYHLDTANNWDDATRWVLRSQCFCKLPDRHAVMNWIHYLAVGEEGDLIGIARSLSHTDAQPQSDAYLYNETLVALLSICFAHCKGAEVKEYKPSRQVRRAAERKGEPSFSYHTIDIRPATGTLREEGDVAKNGLAKALHICRGHFAHYTAEKPLFGKYTGTFYRPMHVRGSAEQGIVGKDYRVHAQ